LGVVPLASAQDLLPSDNGIYKYHRAPRYRESESHPLRVAAYVVHPIGWVLREGIFRPLSYAMGSTEFTRSFFGFREPFDYREPICYDDPGAVPDCRNIAPYSQIGGRQDVEDIEAAPERQVYFPDVNFEFDKSTLTPLGKGRVRQVAQLLASVPSLKVVVEGHTDSVGTDQYNQALGSRRASAVIKELTELSIDPARISPISYGESRPVFTEDEDWARAVNRRVQFTVEGSTPIEPAAPAK
jgi:outer membrane protein OmpA-like peptidoglycan-associated protein